MTYQGINKYEYKYVILYSSIENSITILNNLGNEGWELIDLFKPSSVGEQYKALLKRQILEINV